MAAPTKTNQGRSRALTYQELLDTDTRPVPEVLRTVNPLDLPYQEIAIDRYLSPDFFNLEVEKLCKRVWQMACREDDIPAVGDHLVYEIAGLSFIVVRTASDRIRAYYDACLHRGRLLREIASRDSPRFPRTLAASWSKLSSTCFFPRALTTVVLTSTPEATSRIRAASL